MSLRWVCARATTMNKRTQKKRAAFHPPPLIRKPAPRRIPSQRDRNWLPAFFIYRRRAARLAAGGAQRRGATQHTLLYSTLLSLSWC